MDTRVAVISIIVEKQEAVPALNALLHEYAEYIIGRMGLPYHKKGISVICIAIDAPMNAETYLEAKDTMERSGSYIVTVTRCLLTGIPRYFLV